MSSKSSARRAQSECRQEQESALCNKLLATRTLMRLQMCDPHGLHATVPDVGACPKPQEMRIELSEKNKLIQFQGAVFVDLMEIHLIRPLV